MQVISKYVHNDSVKNGRSFRFTAWFQRMLILPVLLMLLKSCIEPYIAEIEDEPELIAIEASLIKGIQRQRVMISKTTPLQNAEFVPVKGCTVRLFDDVDNAYRYDEYQDGYYILDLQDGDLVEGRNYQLQVLTQGGKEYRSKSVQLQAGVEIDSVYFEIESRIESYTGDDLEGLQFYIDLRAPDTISRFFRWKLVETFEYTSAGPINYFYYNSSLEPVPPSDIWALYRCWKTTDIKDIYLSNTINLIENEKKRIPLKYVSTESDRLKIRYSLLINQYSLSEGAYNYFNQNMVATQEGGGLYNKQPEQPLTNFFNVNDTTERVIGYFWLSVKSSKRIFVERINDLDVKDHFYPLEVFNLEDHGDGPFPLYIMEDASGTRITGSPYCFDCTRRGGITVRPDFW
ncbi:MAG: DUF4249 domain-containing protein [Bacteroidales bacterium]|nr:DUF4249 domain-containing protein [Bacteroidales bacterium]